MNDSVFQTICHKFLADIRSGTPIRTGNLAYNATRLNMLSNAKFEVKVDQKIAPYFAKVNTVKTFYNAKGQGYPNRNYHYFEEATKKAIENLAESVGGIIVHD